MISNNYQQQLKIRDSQTRMTDPLTLFSSFYITESDLSYFVVYSGDSEKGR